MGRSFIYLIKGLTPSLSPPWLLNSTQLNSIQGITCMSNEIIKLPYRHELFVQHYVSDPSSVAAAYERAGYVRDDGNAHKLFNSASVQARLAQVTEGFVATLGATREAVVARLAAIAFADVKSILDCYGRVLPLVAWPQEMLDAVQSLEIDAASGVVTGGKLGNRIAALRELAKVLGMFDSDQKSRTSPIQIVMSEMDMLL
jgi:hypothetical protein